MPPGSVLRCFCEGNSAGSPHTGLTPGSAPWPRGGQSCPPPVCDAGLDPSPPTSENGGGARPPQGRRANLPSLVGEQEMCHRAIQCTDTGSLSPAVLTSPFKETHSGNECTEMWPRSFKSRDEFKELKQVSISEDRIL